MAQNLVSLAEVHNISQESIRGPCTLTYNSVKISQGLRYLQLYFGGPENLSVPFFGGHPVYVYYHFRHTHAMRVDVRAYDASTLYKHTMRLHHTV